MGLLATIAGPIANSLSSRSTGVVIASGLASLIVLTVLLNVLKQLLFRNPKEPPVVFHWVPFIGSTITYGIDPYRFFFRCRQKYGDVFTFILLGKKTTVCLGTKGNDFILNGKLKDVNAEEIYTPLTTPVFGKDVVYDCPNAKLMEQKKFVKFGLTSEALRSYVPLIAEEVEDFIKRSTAFKGSKGSVNVPPTMAEITLYTASRSLQGKEVRDKFDSSFADLYHDLDMGFTPINFMLPWAPLPQNRKRDFAQKKMAQTYMDIVQARREGGGKKESEDMIWNLMSSVYKNGAPVPDMEVAHIMIALLMAGQHSSSSTSAWIMLRLATRPDIMEELYQEQIAVLGSDLPPLTYDDLQRLPLNSQVVKETLRIHAPIHSIMRKVKSPMPVDGTSYIIPTSHVLLAAPGVTSKIPEHFPNPSAWEPHRWDAGADQKEEEEEEKVDYGYGLVTKGASSPYLPFGAGRHRCIGEQFAYVQLGTITATLVRGFKFRNPPDVDGVVGTDYSIVLIISGASIKQAHRGPEEGVLEGVLRTNMTALSSSKKRARCDSMGIYVNRVSKWVENTGEPWHEGIEIIYVKKEMRIVKGVDYGKPYKIHEVPSPSKLEEYDLLVKVAVASLCHTDSMIQSGVFGAELPQVASHEGSGTVVAVGSSINDFKPGDRVMCGLPFRRCGKCPSCLGPEDYHQYCPNLQGHLGVTVDGAFAEYVICDGREAGKLPDAMSFETAAPLACAGCTVYRGVVQAKLNKGQWLGIVGSGGGLGHLGIQFAKAMGLKVVGVDARDEGLALSKQEGADVVVDARKEKSEVVKEVQNATGGQGVDATVNVSDAKSAAATAAAITRIHGRLIQIAQPDEVSFPMREFIFRDIRVEGSLICSRGQAQQMLQMVVDHNISVKTNVFHGLKKIPELVDFAHAGKMQGKGIVVVDEEAIKKEKDSGLKMV
ncbi:MAG: hypothetical protein M1830_001655 [Pleopsidium flavum]|nr:MAG: hypothetical protein M1830_001655 [Pleopsidium flavum]